MTFSICGKWSDMVHLKWRTCMCHMNEWNGNSGNGFRSLFMLTVGTTERERERERESLYSRQRPNTKQLNWQYNPLNTNLWTTEYDIVVVYRKACVFLKTGTWAEGCLLGLVKEPSLASGQMRNQNTHFCSSDLGPDGTASLFFFFFKRKHLILLSPVVPAARHLLLRWSNDLSPRRS